tara:strand:+ start:3640 stop:3810 length:171 start_codon:yes stop_codon:yes gene_type:complete
LTKIFFQKNFVFPSAATVSASIPTSAGSHNDEAFVLNFKVQDTAVVGQNEKLSAYQ